MEKNSTSVVMAVGGAGCNMVNAISQEVTGNVRLIYCDTDKKRLSTIGYGEKILLGYSALLEKKSEVINSIAEASSLILVFGLGGGTDMGASEEITRWAKEKLRTWFALAHLKTFL